MPTLNNTPYYGGGQQPDPANVILVTGVPSPKAIENEVGTIAIDNANNRAYVLSSKTGGVAQWTRMGAGSASGVQELGADSGGASSPNIHGEIFINGSSVTGTQTVTNPSTNSVLVEGIAASTTQVGTSRYATTAEAAAQTATDATLTPSDITSLFSTHPLPATQGGTGLTSLAVGAIPTGNGTGSFGSLAPVGAVGQPILSTGAGHAPAYGDLTVPFGGTGVTAFNNGGILVGSGTGPVGSLNAPTNGQIPIGNGTNPVNATITPGAGINVTNGPGTITISATGASFPESNIYYVAAGGSDTNDGRNLNSPFLTFQYGINQAAAQVPSASNPFAVVCLDGGVYTENIVCQQYVNVFAPNATLNGTISCNDFSDVTFDTLNVPGSVPGVFKDLGAGGTARVNINVITASASGGGFICTDGVLMCTWKTLTIQNGFGIGDNTSAIAHMHLDGGDIYITGTGTGIARNFGGTTVGKVDHILATGSGTGTALYVSNGTLDIDVHTINTTTAYNVFGATSVLNLFCNDLAGTRTATSGGTVNIWTPPAAMANGQLVIGAGVGSAPTVANLTAGSGITITNGPGSIQISAPALSIPVSVADGGTGQTTYTDGQILIGNSLTSSLTKNTLTSGTGASVVNGHGVIVITAPGVFQSNIIYVSKTGNSLNNGLTLNFSLPSISLGITAAVAETPSATNRWVVYVEDDGIYNENVTMQPFVDLYAPNATVQKQINCADNSNVVLGTSHVLSTDSTTEAQFRYTGTGVTNINVTNVVNEGAVGPCVSFVNNGVGGTMNVIANYAYIAGDGTNPAYLFDATTGTNYNNFDINRIVLTTNVGGNEVFQWEAESHVTAKINSVIGDSATSSLIAPTNGPATFTNSSCDLTVGSAVGFLEGIITWAGLPMNLYFGNLDCTGGTAIDVSNGGAPLCNLTVGTLKGTVNGDPPFINKPTHTFRTTSLSNTQLFPGDRIAADPALGLIPTQLPTNAIEGDVITLINRNNNYLGVGQGANQQIRVGSDLTTLGATGSLTLTSLGATVQLMCLDNMSQQWVALSYIGTYTVV